MGKRRIKLCKACGRKFTPKNQSPIEALEETPGETCVEPNEATGSVAVSEPDRADEPTEEPEDATGPDENSGIVSSPEEEWTS